MLRSDYHGQASLLNLLLRNYLHYNLIEQADKLVSKSTFPETASNNEWARFLYYLGKKIFSKQGPVVQSIFSLITLLRQLKYMQTSLLDMLFCSAKDSHIFPTKKQCICNIYVLNFNVMLTNNHVNFKQLAPCFEESLLLRRGISLKIFFEKVKFSNCDFCNNFHDYKDTHM